MTKLLTPPLSILARAINGRDVGSGFDVVAVRTGENEYLVRVHDIANNRYGYSDAGEFVSPKDVAVAVANNPGDFDVVWEDDDDDNDRLASLEARIDGAIDVAEDTLENVPAAALLAAGAWRIESNDDAPEDLDGTGRLWVVSTRTLYCSDEKVAAWTRCTVGDYRESEWRTEEDTNGGDCLPAAVETLLDALGLEDELPDGPDEPGAPDEDPNGDWGVGYTDPNSDPIGADPDAPGHIYSTPDDAEAAIAAHGRAMAQQGCGNRLAPFAVLMHRDNGLWAVVTNALDE